MGDPARPSFAAPLEPGALPPFYACTHLAESGSTNDEAKALAAAGAPEGTLIWADRQTAGRGRRGRAWQSPLGNLYASLILRPAAPLGQVGQLGFAAALAIAETATMLLPPSAVVQCKWPNDVLIGGRKAAGLLLETDSRADGTAVWLVVGFGVNVASSPDGMEFPATSLAACGGTAEVAQVLGRFSERFLAWYQIWRNAGFAPLRVAWLERAAGLGQPIRVRLENRTLEGVFNGLDADGALLLHSAGQGSKELAQRITAGDIFFPDALIPIRTQAG